MIKKNAYLNTNSNQQIFAFWGHCHLHYAEEYSELFVKHVGWSVLKK